MVLIEKTGKRTFVLDTNVLLHDPSCIFRFEEHDLVIPMTVLEELDRLKAGYNEVARSARQVVRTLSDLLDDVPMETIAEGVPLPHGGERPTGRLFLVAELMAEPTQELVDDSPDNRIIAETRRVQQARPDETVILVTKDVNLRVKCFALGIPAEDYRNDQLVSDIDTMSSGYELVDADFWEPLGDSLAAWKDNRDTYYELETDRARGWHPGMLICEDIKEKGFEAIVREVDGRRAKLEVCRDYRSQSHGVWGASAHGTLQNFALNLLLDPTYDLVSIVGPAGTGKTFLAMAAALHQ